MFVSEIKENYDYLNLPEEFAAILPEFCETCGSPMEISESLTRLHCGNPRCRDKMVMRIKQLCQDLGVLGLGESTIEKFVEKYNPDSPMDIFELKEGMQIADNMSVEVSNGIINQIQRKKKMQLWEYVMFANVPQIRTSALKLFDGYVSLDDAYADFEEGGIKLIQKKLGLGLGEKGVSVNALKIYNNLMEYKADLYSGIKEVEIIDLSDKVKLKVVCSDQVGGRFKTKSEFYTYMNNEYADKIHIEFLPSVSKDIDYLVWAGADGSPARYTSKVQKIEGYNAKGSHIPIVTATQFIEEIERLKKVYIAGRGWCLM